MKRWLAVLGVLLAGALLLPQHAWSQGAIVNNGLQLQGTPLSIKFYDGTNTGTLQPATLTGNQTWTLPDASGTILLSSTIGTTAWVLGGNTLTSVQNLGTQSNHDLPIITNNVERMRITAAGEVVVRNQAPAGATQVIIQAGANQSGVDLLQWRNNGGLTLGSIRHEGSVVLVYDPPTRQAFFAVANPSGVPLIGIGPDPAGWGVGVYEPTGPFGQLRAGMGKVSGEWRVGVGDLAAQNGVLLNWATTGTANEPRIVVANGSLANPVFLVDREGDVTVRGTTVALPNIPDNSAATEVLVWSGGNVQRRSAEGLAWLLTGNSITSAWNGTSGNFLGTTNAQPLVIATTNTASPQPIQFWTNNTERVRITATGDVGIGTANPTERLQVSDGNIAITNTDGTARELRLYEPSGAGTNYTAFRAQAQASDITYTLPASLTPTSTVAAGILQTDASGNLSWLTPSALVSGGAWALTGNSITGTEFLGTTNAQPLVIRTNNTERMRVTATGDVGIGTASPTERLQVSDGNIAITNTDGTARELRLYEPFDGTNNYTAFRAQAQTSNITYTLPASLTPTSTVAAGILQTDASGNLSWLTPSALVSGGAWALTGNSITGTEFLGTTNAQPLVIRTDNTERMRITAAGDVVVQNQAAGTPTTVLRVLGGNGGAGATQVVLQAGVGQSGVDLLQWQNNGGLPLGFIRPDGSVVLVYDPPTARQAFFAVANPSGVPLIGIGPNPSGWGVGVYEPIAPYGDLRAGMGKVGTEWWMGVGDLGAQNGVLLSWKTSTTDNEPRIVVANGSLANPVFLVDREGDVTVRGTTVALPNIPDNSAATEVLVWSGGNVQRRSAEGLAWLLTGNSITSAWNGTSGNFLGTTNAQPLVIATTNTASPQPIQFWTNNTERMRITATGDVGIGTASPTERLQVSDGNIAITNTDGTARELRLYEPFDGTNNYTAFRAQAQTSNITYTLPASLTPTSTVAAGILQTDASGNLSWLTPSALVSGGAWALTGNSITGTEFLGTTNAQPLVIRTDNTERMRVTAAGDVGIGTSTPGARLHVVGTGRFDGQLTVTTGGAAITGNSTVTGALTVSSDVSVGGNGSVTGNLTVAGNTTLGDASGDAVTVNAGTVSLPNIPDNSTATEVLVWNSSGSKVERRAASGLIGAAGGWAVGGNAFGGTNSTQVLGTTTSDNLQIQTGGANAIYFNTNTNAGGDTVEAQLTSTGQLAFFTTGTPGFRVDLPNNSANAVGRIRATGISFWSSMRWKEDIRPIPNALEKALALRGVNFRWKPEYGGGEDIGFIMEEVDRVVPEVVQRDERTGELLGMDYARLTALLVEALKEEHRRNEALRAEVAELRSLVEQLLRQNGERGTSSQPSTIQDAWLGQNIPNPFAGTTTIPYYIPAGVSRAELVVRDVGGRELRRLELAERGAHGQVVLEMGLMGSGTYEYALVLDGRVVAVKQMTLVR